MTSSRILPAIDPGTPQPSTPATLPGGIHWHDVRGSLDIASGWRAIGIAEQRGRTRRLRRMAERAARKAGAA